MIPAGEVGTPRLADALRERLQVTDKAVSSPPVHFSDDSNQAILGKLFIIESCMLLQRHS